MYGGAAGVAQHIRQRFLQNSKYRYFNYVCKPSQVERQIERHLDSAALLKLSCQAAYYRLQSLNTA
jgi:hypothetical protein